MSNQVVNSELNRVKFRLRSATARMVWKELRHTVPLFVIFVFGLLAMLSCMSFVDGNSKQAYWIFPTWILINIFALTIGVYLFAPENEKRTISFLNHLPINSRFAVGMKCAVGLTMLGLFVVFGAGLSWFEIQFLRDSNLPSIPYDNQKPSFFFFIFLACLSPLECFLWGAFWSTLLKRSIVAIVIAIGCIILSWWVPSALAVVADNAESFSPTSERSMMVSFIATKVVLMFSTLIGLGVVGSRWLGRTRRYPALNSENESNSTETQSHSTTIPQSSDWPSSTTRKPAVSRIYGSLIWQSFRQYRSAFLWAIGCAIPFFIFCGLLSFGLPSSPGASNSFILLFVPVLVVTLIGSLFAFSKDHEDSNFRFFQQHREYGKKLWLARLLPAALLSVACAFFLIVVVTIFSQFYLRPRSILNWNHLLSPEIALRQIATLILVSLFIAFSIGQFCSLLFRSYVFSFLTMVAMETVAIRWVSWLYYIDGAWRFVLPIPIAMLLITWWRAPRWLADRRRVRDYLLPWGALAVVTCATGASFIHHRVNEVPIMMWDSLDQRIAVSFDENFQNQKDLFQYERSRLLLDASESSIVSLTRSSIQNVSSNTPQNQLFLNLVADDEFDLDEFIELNRKSIELIRQADMPNTWGAYIPASTELSQLEFVSKIRILIAAEAVNHELDGNLEQSLECWLRLLRFDNEFPVFTTQPSVSECLIHWGKLPNQETALILRAIAAINWDWTKWSVRAASNSHFAFRNFENWYQRLISPDELPETNFSLNHSVSMRPEFSRLPWEAKRSRRIALNRISNSQAIHHSLSELALDCELNFAHRWGSDYPNSLQSPLKNSILGTRELQREFFTVNGIGDESDVLSCLKLIQQRRYAQVHLALAAWKTEHAQYPDRLFHLVPNYLTKLPVDIFHGGQFAYSATGRDAPINWQHPKRILANIEENTPSKDPIFAPQGLLDSMINPNTPFLLPWSTLGSFPLMLHATNSSETITSYYYGDPRSKGFASRHVGIHVEPLVKTDPDQE